MKFVCVKCNCEMSCKKNEVAVEVAYVEGQRSLTNGDLWACQAQECDVEIVAGFALRGPYVTEWGVPEGEYEEIRKLDEDRIVAKLEIW